MTPMTPMQFAAPKMNDGGLGPLGMKIMQAALAQRGGNGRPGAPGAVPGAPMSLTPAGAVNPMQMGLLGRLFGGGQQQGQPQPPFMGPTAPLPADAGGAGPAPNALTGLW